MAIVCICLAIFNDHQPYLFTLVVFAIAFPLWNRIQVAEVELCVVCDRPITLKSFFK